MQGKLLLIGQAPSKTGDNLHPLEGRIGRMLSGLAGVAFDDYLMLTERINLFSEWTGRREGAKGDSWDDLAARQRASELVRGFRDRTVVLLGRNVGRAFGLDRLPWMTWIDFEGGRAAVLPHPSGIVRWWNDPKNRAEAGRFLKLALARSMSC